MARAGKGWTSMPDPTRQSVSASRAAALFDRHPYCTRWMLYHALKDGREIEGASHSRMDWGQRLQPLLLQAAAEDLRLEIAPHDAYVRRGVLGATRDATIIDPQKGPGAVETKCCFDYRTWMERWAGGDAPG
jgi:hypothetical protein